LRAQVGQRRGDDADCLLQPLGGMHQSKQKKPKKPKKEKHLESSKQNYYIISLYVIIKAVLTSHLPRQTG